MSCATAGAVEGGRKSSQGFARERIEVVMACWDMKDSFWLSEE